MKLIWIKIKALKNISASNDSFQDKDTMEEFFLNIVPTFVPMDIPLFQNLNHPNLEWAVELFKMKEFEIALDSKRNSSPGLDQVHYYSIIKNLPTQSKNFF